MGAAPRRMEFPGSWPSLGQAPGTPRRIIPANGEAMEKTRRALPHSSSFYPLVSCVACCWDVPSERVVEWLRAGKGAGKGYSGVLLIHCWAIPIFLLNPMVLRTHLMLASFHAMQAQDFHNFCVFCTSRPEPLHPGSRTRASVGVRRKHISLSHGEGRHSKSIFNGNWLGNQISNQTPLKEEPCFFRVSSLREGSITCTKGHPTNSVQRKF